MTARPTTRCKRSRAYGPTASVCCAKKTAARPSHEISASCRGDAENTSPFSTATICGFRGRLRLTPRRSTRYDSPAFLAGAPAVFSRTNPHVRKIQREPLKADRFTDYLASGDAWRWFSASSFVSARGCRARGRRFQALSGSIPTTPISRCGSGRRRASWTSRPPRPSRIASTRAA